MNRRPPGPFPAAWYRERRAAVSRILNDGILILPASPVRFRRGDSEYRYRPDPELLYLTGHSAPEAVVIIQGEAAGGRSAVFAPPRDAGQERWTGPRRAPEELAAELGLNQGFPIHSLSELLPRFLESAQLAYLRWGENPAVEQLVKESLQLARGRGARTGKGLRGVMDPGQLLDPMRLRKTPLEVERMVAAADLTVEGFQEALRVAAPGQGEWEVEATLESVFRKGGGEGAAFASIVASGPGATTLHYTENQRIMEAGDLLLVDAGADYGGYAGDVTRTIPLSGQFTPEQADLYRVVAGALTAGCHAVKPGAPADAPHQAALKVLCEGLVELKILQGEPDEIRDSGGYKCCFPHQTSHWLGLEVHDAGAYVADGAPILLESGMILTVEPGLYIPADGAEPEGSGRGWERFRGLGIRLEDDILVTPDGHRNLTESLPVDPTQVENFLAD